MTAGAGDYAFNGGDVWLASSIAGDLGMVTETTSILSSVSAVVWLAGPLAAGVAGIGALGLAAALTGNLPTPLPAITMTMPQPTMPPQTIQRR